MNIEILSKGWFYQLNRYFNTLYSIGITTLYKSIDKGNITHEEYVNILKNSWVGDHYTEEDFRSWVVDRYLTPDEFKLITGIDY